MPGTLNNSFEEIATLLRGARRVALACHVRPDGDAIGSLVGLALSLRLAGKEVIALSEDGVPGNLAFLPGTETVLRPEQNAETFDVAVALDTATHERVGDKCRAMLAQADTLVNVDHHGTNPGYGHLNHIDVGSPATGQIVYEFITSQGLPLNDAVMRNLFTAISTDTGSFQFSCTTPRTHEIVAEMMRAGLDTAELARLIYQTCPRRRLELQKVMLNEMRFQSQDRLVSWTLTLDTLRQLAVEPGDTEGLIDTLRAVDSVVAAVIFEEMPEGRIRVSARSKDSRLNVSGVCAQFGGGGHAMAAGARMKGPASDASARFMQALEVELGRLA
jgi:phosphoesterase RecJ-like protein